MIIYNEKICKSHLSYLASSAGSIVCNVWKDALPVRPPTLVNHAQMKIAAARHAPIVQTLSVIPV